MIIALKASIRSNLGIHAIRPLIFQQAFKFHNLTSLNNKIGVNEGTNKNGKNIKEDLYYYEIPGNKLNPHTYFYRILAVPFLKFCGVMFITYYSLSGLWYILESSESKDDKDRSDT
jgi:hypothetical protein